MMKPEEKSHAYLEQWHYKAVATNPLYRLEGMMDVLREDLSMSLSYREEIPIEKPDKTYTVEHIHSYVPSLKLTERIKQLEDDIDGLKKGYHTHRDKKRKYKYD